MKITVVGQLAVISLVNSHSSVLRSEKVCDCFEWLDRRTRVWSPSRIIDQTRGGLCVLIGKRSEWRSWGLRLCPRSILLSRLNQLSEGDAALEKYVQGINDSVGQVLENISSFVSKVDQGISGSIGQLKGAIDDLSVVAEQLAQANPQGRSNQ